MWQSSERRVGARDLPAHGSVAGCGGDGRNSTSGWLAAGCGTHRQVSRVKLRLWKWSLPRLKEVLGELTRHFHPLHRGNSTYHGGVCFSNYVLTLKCRVFPYICWAFGFVKLLISPYLCNFAVVGHVWLYYRNMYLIVFFCLFVSSVFKLR